MSMSTTPKVPKGFGQYSLPTMGGGQADIYNLLKGQFQGGAPDIYNNLLSMAKGDQSMFEKLEAPALRHFQQVTAPGIAARYSGGAGGISGISGSSGMQNALAAAGGNLEEDLQARRMGLMQQSMHDVLNLGNTLLGTPTQQFGLYQKENLWRDIMQMLGGAGSQSLGFGLGSKIANIF